MKLNDSSSNSFFRGIGLWFLWMLAIAWAELVILIYIIVLSYVCQCDMISGFVFFYGRGTNIYLIGAGLFSGVLTGWAHWLILRNRIDHAFGWFLATAAGVLIGWELNMIIQPPSEFIDGIGFLFYPLAVSGVVSSFIQWLVIRRLKGSYLWILASVIGWSCAILGNALANLTEFIGLAISIAIFGIVIINSTAVWLFGRSHQPELSITPG